MLVNEHDSIMTPRVLLVPYSAHHVPTYHEWMQDEEIQKATASEPLTLEEEYSMQRSWRNDADKLTFIVCTHHGEQYYNDITRSPQTRSIVPGTQDAPKWMVGDVNLFLYDDDDDDDDDVEDPQSKRVEGRPKSVIGELEIMIARKDQQGKGLAQETLRAFMSYIQSELERILHEYAETNGGNKAQLNYLRVKIDKDNTRSLRLFERTGFVRTSAEPNYFGEVELRTPVIAGKLSDIEKQIGLEGCGKRVRWAADHESSVLRESETIAKAHLQHTAL